MESKGQWLEDESQVKGIAEICAQVTEELKKGMGEDNNLYLLMQVQSARLAEIVKKGGKSYGVPVHPAILNFCIQFMKKSGRKAYESEYKLLGLPAPSTVDKATAEVASRADDRACGIYTKQIRKINQQLKDQGHPDGYCNERLVSLACDAYDIAEGCRFNLIKGRYDGLDEKEGTPYDVIESKFKALADESAGEAPDEPDEQCQDVLENLALAEYHLVIKAVSLCPGVVIDEVVASGNYQSLTPSVVTRLFTSLESSLLINNIYPVDNVLDAAGENVSYMNGAADSMASEWLPEDLMSKHPRVNFRNYCISRSNGGTRPKAMLSDVLHWIKCTRQAVQRSDQDHASKRNLRRGNEFICIKKVYDIWVATGGMTNQQRHTKLTKAHFYPDGYANMVVSLSTQFFSNSTKQMIEDACNDDDLDSFKEEHYVHMTEMIRHINRLTDITNGRNLEAVGAGGNMRTYDAYYTPETGRKTQEELLDILAWFSDWKAEHDAEVKAGTADEYNFLPRQTWENLNRLILGLVVAIEYYCIKEGFTLVPRKMNTDPCENEFAIHRQSGGSTGAINSTQADLADVNTQAVRGSSRVAKSNNYAAPSKVNTF